MPDSQIMKTKFAMLLSIAALQIANAGILFNVESAGVQQTSVANTITETFNLLPTDTLAGYNSPIGTYTTGAVISEANAWGGANQTLYIAVGAQSSTNSYSLNFGKDLNYFGLNWQAGDAKNELRFYKSGNLVQSFTSALVFAGLPSSYDGNPNNGQNKSEKYAFVNFTTTNGTVFDQVVFFNQDFSTGFETDNHTILRPRDPVTPTVETQAPEPATMALVGAAFMALALKRRR